MPICHLCLSPDKCAMWGATQTMHDCHFAGHQLCLSPQRSHYHFLASPLNTSWQPAKQEHDLQPLTSHSRDADKFTMLVRIAPLNHTSDNASLSSDCRRAQHIEAPSRDSHRGRVPLSAVATAVVPPVLYIARVMLDQQQYWLQLTCYTAKWLRLPETAGVLLTLPRIEQVHSASTCFTQPVIERHGQEQDQVGRKHDTIVCRDPH
jgi:hypothetical protein